MKAERNANIGSCFEIEKNKTLFAIDKTPYGDGYERFHDGREHGRIDRESPRYAPGETIEKAVQIQMFRTTGVLFVVRVGKENTRHSNPYI